MDSSESNIDYSMFDDSSTIPKLTTPPMDIDKLPGTLDSTVLSPTIPGSSSSWESSSSSPIIENRDRSSSQSSIFNEINNHTENLIINDQRSSFKIGETAQRTDSSKRLNTSKEENTSEDMITNPNRRKEENVVDSNRSTTRIHISPPIRLD